MNLGVVNSKAVAHTPQPHIGFANVGIKYSISTMCRGAVPITEHQPADVLERRLRRAKMGGAGCDFVNFSFFGQFIVRMGEFLGDFFRNFAAEIRLRVL